MHVALNVAQVSVRGEESVASPRFISHVVCGLDRDRRARSVSQQVLKQDERRITLHEWEAKKGKTK